MAQYASLSEPDVEWLKLAPSMPSLYTTDIPEFRNIWKTMIDNVNSQTGPLPIDEQRVTVEKFGIQADGFSIPCRTYVPEIKPELGETPGQKFPLLFWSYGGAFCFGTLNDNDVMLKSLAANLRITCVSVDYRKAPENPFPASVNDGYAGFKWALANTEGISVDVSKGVIVGGFSAGGNLSAVITRKALKDRDVRGKITGQILISPYMLFKGAYPDKWKSKLLSTTQNADDMILPRKAVEFYEATYLGGKTENGFNPDFSPLLAPSFEGLPPAYIQIAGCDPFRDEAFLYGELLKEAGVKTRVDAYPGVPHGFHAFAPDFPLCRKQDADFRSAINWLLGRTE
ncbi:hypothetical protein Clacol_007186 [Clathrus columnatus]|uniref:Alpha/beta hydrolase fold-3 domain-containing protein n=1 Tax=Clathrus columnatus TaxID=1419009 RepID=A0AAV5AJS7_9AGAM|nr:hypothetical protein Clacol_007186 [Clathrus columnatus]